jgi:hypothetical protein
MSMSGGELKVLLALDKLATALPAYTSIAGTFYQNSSDNSVQVEELSNTSPYTLLTVGNAPGQITFTADGDSDIRSSLIFLGPSSHPTCSFMITNDGNSPATIIVDSFNATGAQDARGFGQDGASPVSFELRFYTAV